MSTLWTWREIVAKRKTAPYSLVDGESTWVKIKNRSYSQIVGRDEHFERLERKFEEMNGGWHTCAAAAAGS